MGPFWLQPLPLVAILRGVEPNEVVAVGTALTDTGFHVIEVPLNSPSPLQSIERLVRAFGDRCTVGAGTVLNVADVRRVADAGGRLIVTPHTDLAIIETAKEMNLYCTPGTATPSEAFAALHAGADAIKVFPAEQITPKVLHAWRAVLPQGVNVLPVGGITPTGMAEYVRAGATGFGIGSALYKPDRSIGEIEAAAKAFANAWAAIASEGAQE
ncbi:MAG: 2-dehydro-3-deoxy-6-phosphogalactonate aldolase [Rhodanobacteraceae bacterium]|nr:MAG: 2-dehydro-3-deoxy-6-phosphogalactonate aldolase [Rhodanobacteraceae bacterium]